MVTFLYQTNIHIRNSVLNLNSSHSQRQKRNYVSSNKQKTQNVGPNLVFKVRVRFADPPSASSSNFGFRQTDRRTDRRNKHILGLPTSGPYEKTVNLSLSEPRMESVSNNSVKNTVISARSCLVESLSSIIQKLSSEYDEITKSVCRLPAQNRSTRPNQRTRVRQNGKGWGEMCSLQFHGSISEIFATARIPWTQPH